MTKQVIPPELLKIAKYGCKTDCIRKICTCRWYGVACTNICLGCRGVLRECQGVGGDQGGRL